MIVTNGRLQCPACQGPYKMRSPGDYAVSRYATGVAICPPCGEREAFEGYFWNERMRYMREFADRICELRRDYIGTLEASIEAGQISLIEGASAMGYAGFDYNADIQRRFRDAARKANEKKAAS